MNAGRLFVALFVLKADAQEIVGFQHLAGRLGKPRLIPIERWDRGDPRQIEQKAERG